MIASLLRIKWIVVLIPALAIVQVSAQQICGGKPIRMVSAFGGASENVLRVIATKMSSNFNQPIVVDVQPAAAGTIASNIVAKAAPDGCTLLAGTSTTHIYRPLTSKSVTYDPFKDFTSLSMMSEPTFVFVVSSSLGVNDIPELAEYARKNPNKVFLGTSGNGSTGHVMGLDLQRYISLPITYVPFKDSAAPLMSIIGGDIQAAIVPGSEIKRLMSDKRMRVIGMFNDKPASGFEDIKPISKQIPGFKSISVFTAFFGPAKMPPDLVSRLNAAMVSALEDPTVREQFSFLGSTASSSTPEFLADTIKTDYKKVETLLKQAGIQPE